MKAIICGETVKVATAMELLVNGQKVMRVHITGETFTKIEEMVKSEHFDGIQVITDGGIPIKFDGEYTELNTMQRFITDTLDEIQIELCPKTKIV